VAIAHSTGTLTLSGAAVLDGETVTIGGKAYTFQSTLTNVDGNVKVGAYPSNSIQNLYDAINLTGTAGTQYATAMTANGKVRAVAHVTSPPWLRVKAQTAGTIGNALATTETLTNGAWGGATLSGGVGTASDYLTEFLSAASCSSEVHAKTRAVIARIAAEGAANVNVHDAITEILRTTNMDSGAAAGLGRLLCPIES
jgi:hypothetical protein